MKWSVADRRGTAAALEPWWDLLTADVPPDALGDFKPPAAPGDDGAPPEVGELEDALAALSAAGRHVATRGFGTPPHSGRVAALFLGDGGLPKLRVNRVDVRGDGVVGDRQKTRKHHGRVWQALCLWSAPVLAQLQAEGHPIFPGACGENILVDDIDWPSLRPGTRIRLGSVVAEVSVPTIPCKQIRPFFTDGAIRRVDHDRHPGSSRWYATVVEPGVIAVGDVARVE